MAVGETPRVKLSQYTPNDIPKWIGNGGATELGTYNGDMKKIDLKFVEVDGYLAAAAAGNLKANMRAVGPEDIQEDAVLTEHILDRQVDSPQIALLAVKDEHLDVGVISPEKIASYAADGTKGLTGDQIKHQTIKSEHLDPTFLGTLATTTSGLGLDTVFTRHIKDWVATPVGEDPPSGVTEGKIADGAVTTRKLEDYNSANSERQTGVTTAKIAALAVTKEKLADGAVVKEKVLDGALPINKITPSSIMPQPPINIGAITIADGGIIASIPAFTPTFNCWAHLTQDMAFTVGGGANADSTVSVGFTITQSTAGGSFVEINKGTARHSRIGTNTAYVNGSSNAWVQLTAGTEYSFRMMARNWSNSDPLVSTSGSFAMVLIPR
jgi:hypothetical protein